MISESPLKHIKKRPQGKDHQRYKCRALSADELTRFVAESEAGDRPAAVLAESKGLSRRPQTQIWIPA